MRNSIVFLVANVLAATNPLCHAVLCNAGNESPHIPKGIDIELFTRLFLTETESEFDYKKTGDADDDVAKEMWRSATDFEWCRAMEEENLRSRKYPFLVCVSDDEEVPVANTGNDMRHELMGIYQGMNMETVTEGNLDHDIDAETWDKYYGLMYYPPLYNGASLYCTYSTMFASDAIAMSQRFLTDTSHDILVQPYMMSMKMMPHSVDEVMERMTPIETTASVPNQTAKEGRLNPSVDGKNNDNRKRSLRGDADATHSKTEEFGGNPRNPLEALPAFDAMICPGVLPVDATTQQKTELIRDIDDFLCGGRHDDGEEVGGFFSGLTDAMFWTTEKSNSRNDTMASSMQRSQHWKKVFGLDREGQEQCYNAFRGKLKWHIGGSSETSEASLHVSFQHITEEVSSASPDSHIAGDMSTSRDCAMMLLVALGLHPALCHVEVRHATETLNLQAQWLIQSGEVNERPWFDVGVDGRNQIVAVSDTGIDADNCYFWDADVAVGDPNHRKIVEYNSFVDSVDYLNGHGTHVAGTVVGRRAVGGGDLETTGLADGVAREARVAFADIGDEEGNILLPFDDFTLLRTGRSSNNSRRASIHSASWGTLGVNFYTFQARNFDRFMVENDDFMVLVAAGNSGQTDVPGSITSPATAKNVIAVGASQSFGPSLFPGQRGPDFVADFSSRGPTADGRTKPEVVAPGMFLLSAGGDPSVTGECDPDGATPPRPLGSASGVLSLAGTSMATPAASGTAALIRQYFEDGFYPNGVPNPSDAFSPSGALVKAVLLNGAQYLTAVDNLFFTTPIQPYDNAQNFGRISLADSLFLADGKSRVEARIWDREAVLDGNVKTYELIFRQTGTCSASVLSVTLVWMDPAAPPGCRRCLLNNLDLRVIAISDGTVHFPNGMDNASDAINTAERVQVGGLSVGNEPAEFRLEVSATNLATQEQSFALVATGCFGISSSLSSPSSSTSPTPNPESSFTATTAPTPSLVLPPTNKLKPPEEVVTEVVVSLPPTPSTTTGSITPTPQTTQTPSTPRQTLTPPPTRTTTSPTTPGPTISTFEMTTTPTFLTRLPTAQEAPSASPYGNDDNNTTTVRLGILVGLAAMVLIGLVLLLGFWFWRQQRDAAATRRRAAAKAKNKTKRKEQGAPEIQAQALHR